MGKFTFVLGAGVGYLLGTRAGRQQFEKIKRASKNVWADPRVQQGVTKVEGRVGQVAREQGSAVTDKVAGIVKSKIGSGSRQSGSTGEESGNGSEGSMDPTPPQPDVSR